MASESRSVSGSVTTESDSRERVAYDLMKFIWNAASGEPSGESDKRNRDYCLTLYRQCLAATRGNNMEEILSYSKKP